MVHRAVAAAVVAVAGVAEGLLVGKSLHRQDVEFKDGLGLEPDVCSAGLVQGVVSDDVVVLVIVCPDVVACGRSLVVRGTGRVVQKCLSEADG